MLAYKQAHNETNKLCICISLAMIVLTTRVSVTADNIKSQLTETQEKLGLSQMQLDKTQTELEETREELEYTREELNEETSLLERTIEYYEGELSKRIPYIEIIEMESTAYTHTGNRTRTGTVPEDGRTIAVDPNVISLGSRVYIEGVGFRTAEDTGGVIKGNIIDIFMDEERSCINWGRRTVKVYILKEE